MPCEFTGRMFNIAAEDKVDLIIEQKICKNRYEYIRIKIHKNRAKAELTNYIYNVKNSNEFAVSSTESENF